MCPPILNFDLFMCNQKNIIESIPQHLRQFCETQDYAQYTAQDQAVWRYIMRRQVRHLSKYAHEVYLEGLQKTGISIEHIPSIDEMNACLSQLGWRAVVVEGFIPPAVFVEFHCHRILPIALDIRSLEHILYTPAPDIVHEAGGHAPFLVDIDYGEFLQKFGEYGMKALSSCLDDEIYEAIRDLSFLKEEAGVTDEVIQKAEQNLQLKILQNTKPSEASLLSRLYWWTAEYGLVGSVGDYKIFGAGLLSSTGESVSCLNDDLCKKIPLTVDCVLQSYDITEVQPQLFVTRGCRHMVQVLEEFADSLCFRRGGAASLQKAIEAQSICTAVYSSGLEVSGRFSEVLQSATHEPIYLRTSGPTQLAYQHLQLEGHGTDYHAQGFGSPVGKLQNIDTPLENLTVDELKLNGIKMGTAITLNFLSGMTVQGFLKNILRKDHKNILFSFENCTVQDVAGNILFDPSWGTFDMAVGVKIVSVYAGSADRSQFDVFPVKSKRTARKREFTDQQQKLFLQYAQVRSLRESGLICVDDLNKIMKKIADENHQDWLLCLELLELARNMPRDDESENLIKNLEAELARFSSQSEILKDLIQHGLAL